MCDCYPQSYGIHHKTEMSIEHLSYVDYVELGGTADLAGMRKGMCRFFILYLQ